MATYSPELGAFMEAIRGIESSGDYTATGPPGSYGVARGAYQILDSNWGGWAAEAGVGGANWKDPAAQDTVAAYKMNQYYEKYGDWRLVAAAWFAGSGTADRLAANGINDTEALMRSDALGTTVGGYINKAVRLMNSSTTGGSPGAAPTTPAAPPGGQAGPTTATPPSADLIDPKTFVGNVFSQVSNLIAGGARSAPGSVAQTLGTLEGPQVPGAAPMTAEAADTGFLPDLTQDQGLPPDVAQAPDTGVTGEPGTWGQRDDAYYSMSNAQRLANPAYQQRAQEVTQISAQVQAIFPGVSIGQHRELDENANYSGSASINSSGGSTRSDHYWGGALDISGSEATLNQVAAWFRDHTSELGVAGILWQVANHYDHVHVSFLPPSVNGSNYTQLPGTESGWTPPPVTESKPSYNSDPDIGENFAPGNEVEPSTRSQQGSATGGRPV